MKSLTGPKKGRCLFAADLRAEQHFDVAKGSTTFSCGFAPVLESAQEKFDS
jgi:hypothetical protein